MAHMRVLLCVATAAALRGPCARRRPTALRAAEVDAAQIQAAADAVLNSNEILICPALATSNVAKLGEEVQAAADAGADVIHVNVMDGHFTEKMTLGPMFVKALREYGVTAPLDVQLTATDVVDTLIQEFAAAGANYITFHPEGVQHVDRSLTLIRNLGLKCGLVLNPGTPTTVLESVLHKVDMVLLMSINPGFKGEKFNEVIYQKAKAVKAMIQQSGRRIRLQVDGGANLNNIRRLAESGIDAFVVGRGVFHSDDYAQAIRELRSRAEAGARLA